MGVLVSSWRAGSSAPPETRDHCTCVREGEGEGEREEEGIGERGIEEGKRGGRGGRVRAGEISPFFYCMYVLYYIIQNLSIVEGEKTISIAYKISRGIYFPHPSRAHPRPSGPNLQHPPSASCLSALPAYSVVQHLAAHPQQRTPRQAGSWLVATMGLAAGDTSSDGQNSSV